MLSFKIIWRKNPHNCSVGRGKFLIIWVARICETCLVRVLRAVTSEGMEKKSAGWLDSLKNKHLKYFHNRTKLRNISALWELFITYNQKQNWFVIIMIKKFFCFLPSFSSLVQLRIYFLQLLQHSHDLLTFVSSTYNDKLTKFQIKVCMQGLGQKEGSTGLFSCVSNGNSIVVII